MLHWSRACCKGLSQNRYTVNINGYVIFVRLLWDFSIAGNALGVCVMAPDWERGKKILDEVQRMSQGFLDPNGVDRERGIWHRFGTLD